MSELRLVSIPPPTGGLDLVSSPDNMGRGFAPWMENFLPGVPGKLPVRGPLTTASTDELATWNAKPIVSATYNFATNAAWLTRSANASGNIKPDEVYERAAVSNTDLDLGRTYNIAGSVDLSEGAAARTFYGPGVKANGTSWGFEYHSQTNQSTVDLGLTGPRQWMRRLICIKSDDTATSYAPTAAPSCGIDVSVHLNRLFVLGGYPPGVTTQPWSFSCLFYMETDLSTSGLPATGTITDWQTATGVTNRIDIPGHDLGKALAVLNQYLVIFKEESIWLLYGSSPESFTLRKAVDGIGCLDRDSVIQADNGIYFRSRRGIEFFDGASCTVVSSRINPIFEDSVAFPFYLSRTTAGIVGPNFIEFRVQNALPGTDWLSLWMNRSDQSWTVASGAASSSRAYWIRGLRLFVSGTKMYGSYLAEGQFSHLTGTGTAATYPYGTGGPGVIGGIDDEGFEPSQYTSSGMVYDIGRPSAKVVYPRVSLAEPRYSAQLHRAFLDSKAIGFGEDADEENVWTWRGVSSTEESYLAGNYNPLFTETIKSQGRTAPNSPITYADSQYWLGRRTVVDTFQETDDIFFIVDYTPPTPGVGVVQPVRAELYDGGVEYQVTRQRRTTQPRPD